MRSCVGEGTGIGRLVDISKAPGFFADWTTACCELGSGGRIVIVTLLLRRKMVVYLAFTVYNAETLSYRSYLSRMVCPHQVTQ